MNLGKGNTTFACGAESLNGLEQFVVEPISMCHGRVATVITSATVLEFPRKTFAWAFLAVVVGEWVGLEETKKRKELANSVLQGRTGQTQPTLSLKSEDGACSVAGAVFDAMRFIEHNPMPINAMQEALLLDDSVLAPESTLLLAITGLEQVVCRKYNIVLLHRSEVGTARASVVDVYRQRAVGILFNLILPLDDGDCRCDNKRTCLACNTRRVCCEQRNRLYRLAHAYC